MTQIIILLILLGCGYFSGRYFEQKHYKSLEAREKMSRDLPVITGEWKSELGPDDEGEVFGAGVVVASDYFKSFVSGLRNLFGGRMHSYESLIDRGRREALLRMKKKAKAWGAEKIVNLRIETSTVNSASANKRSLPCIELFAYGTAIRKQKHKNDV